MHRNGQLTPLLNYLRCCNVILIQSCFWRCMLYHVRNVRFKKDISFSSNAVFHMFVTAVCLLFLTRGVICFMNVKLVRVSQHKPVTAGHYVIVTWRTVGHVYACFKAVCSTMQNHVITPCIICHEACEVGIPRWKSIIKMEELCPIRLKYKE